MRRLDPYLRPNGFTFRAPTSSVTLVVAILAILSGFTSAVAEDSDRVDFGSWVGGYSTPLEGSDFSYTKLLLWQEGASLKFRLTGTGDVVSEDQQAISGECYGECRIYQDTILLPIGTVVTHDERTKVCSRILEFHKRSINNRSILFSRAALERFDAHGTIIPEDVLVMVQRDSNSLLEVDSVPIQQLSGKVDPPVKQPFILQAP